jgi:acetyl-CoA carboxylase carboxyl transferase subunit alpha
MSKKHFLEFEQPIAELEAKIEELRYVQSESAVDISEEIDRLDKKSQQLTKDIYSSLSPWQVTQIARHPQRPYTLDYLQKGRDTRERATRNFGMSRPEGYRKALRLMKLAEKFRLPVFTFVDTPGAYPGIDAEERGQSEAIGRNIFEMAQLEVPIITTIIGEGGSGGALAISVADQLLMLQFSIYSVISPEGCAHPLEDRGEGPGGSGGSGHHGSPAQGARPGRQDHQRACGRGSSRPQGGCGVRQARPVGRTSAGG